ncbi:TPA: acyltransferase family protein, partial [Bacillus cereus]|nr:acyltransferase family protein [Bacillus cereus]
IDFNQKGFLNNLRILLCFGTPMFIFISELVISKVYKDGVPKHFLTKRIRYILIPYTVMGLFYALQYTYQEEDFLHAFVLQSAKNIFLGDFHGYFILIIMQFYILHAVLFEFFRRANVKKVLLIAFIINVIYLAIFNFIPVPDNAIGEYIWLRFSWVPFVGWLFYFCLAYYCGIYYTEFKEKVIRYKKVIYLITCLSAFLVVLLNNSGILTLVSSKRVDILIFTTMSILALYSIFSRMDSVPNLVNLISKYSFSIYLLHVFYIKVFEKIYSYFTNENSPLIIVVLFIGSIVASAISAHILNCFWWGKFIVGKLGRDYQIKR